MPGITVCPVTSMTRAPAGACTAAAGPTVAILPSRITIDCPVLGAAPVPSITVALVSTTVGSATDTNARVLSESAAAGWARAARPSATAPISRVSAPSPRETRTAVLLVIRQVFPGHREPRTLGLPEDRHDVPAIPVVEELDAVDAACEGLAPWLPARCVGAEDLCDRPERVDRASDLVLVEGLLLEPSGGAGGVLVGREHDRAGPTGRRVESRRNEAGAGNEQAPEPLPVPRLARGPGDDVVQRPEDGVERRHIGGRRRGRGGGVGGRRAGGWGRCGRRGGGPLRGARRAWGPRRWRWPKRWRGGGRAPWRARRPARV